MTTLTVNNGFPQEPLKQAEAIRVALRCGRAGCPCSKPGPRGVSHCPAHSDEHPSLDVDTKDGRVLFICRAGCPQNLVLGELKRRGLWLAVRTLEEPVHRVRYELRDVNGNLIAIHERVDLPEGRKRFFWVMPDGRLGLHGVRPVDLLFGLELLRDHPGEPVVVVEGEKCAVALQQAGFLAVGTVCGASSTPSETVFAAPTRPPRDLVG